MRIVLENDDVILFKQIPSLIGYDYVCSVGECDKKGVDWKIENIKAEKLFEKICGETDWCKQHNIVANISALLGWTRKIKEEKQTREESIYVTKDEHGTFLEVRSYRFKLDEDLCANLRLEIECPDWRKRLFDSNSDSIPDLTPDER